MKNALSSTAAKSSTAMVETLVEKIRMRYDYFLCSTKTSKSVWVQPHHLTCGLYCINVGNVRIKWTLSSYIEKF